MREYKHVFNRESLLFDMKTDLKPIEDTHEITWERRLDHYMYLIEPIHPLTADAADICEVVERYLGLR